VAQFGAFVDLGVHQDGLIHVSQLSAKFVQDAREVVKTGDIVKVRVLEVDAARKRISLSMKPEGSGGDRGGAGRGNRFEGAGRDGRYAQPARPGARTQTPPQPSAMASAFARLQRGESK